MDPENAESTHPSTEDADPEMRVVTANESAPSTVEHYHKTRWKRLSKNYSDKYLDIFRQSQQTLDVDDSLLASQIGSVTWTPLEKQRFFDALAREGRHGLPAIAAAIGSKSEIEVIKLLLKLKDANIDRQRYSQYSKNISHAEIDSAVEIDEELESLLEEAADALAAFQNYYDLSAEKNKSSGIWLIDSRIAAYIRQKRETMEDNDTEGGPAVKFTSEKGKNDALEMFHIDTMLELGRRIFMNSPPDSDLDHWTEVAEDDEEPSITVDALQYYYNLLKSLVQRVLQSAIFLAKSRIRSSTTYEYAPAAVLKDIDVLAALNTLNLPVDSFERWAGFPRRSGVRIVSGSHQKGGTDTEALSLQQVEDALSIRASRGRRRSLSSTVSTSSLDEDGDNEQAIDRGLGLLPNPEMPHGEGEQLRRSTSRDTLRDSTPSDGASGGHDFSGVDHSSTDTSSDTGNGDDELAAAEGDNPELSRKRRRLILEEAQDEFLEELDHSAKDKEAARLRYLLGFGDGEERPGEGLGKRPKTWRKTEEDLRDWSDIAYRSSWERKRSAHNAFDSSSDE